MAMNEPSAKTEITGVDAYTPAEMEDKAEKVGIKKATMPILPSFLLAVVAGGAIGLGGMYFCIVLADSSLSFAVQRVLGGSVFALGLSLVLIGGAELFTGSTLTVMPMASGHISIGQMLRNWVVVWVGNFVGAAGLVFLVYMSHHMEMNNGGVGAATIKLAIGKIQLDSVTIFFKGILCNLMVCLAVWLAYACRSAGDKVIAMILPIGLFVAAGFEHCVANMYFLPMAWLLTVTGHVPAGLDVSAITIPGIVHNLVFATLGNIVGGSVMVGGMYWLIYRKGMGQAAPKSFPAGPTAEQYRATPR
ncbi:formate/nitrite transporter family protein [Telmatospirillum sp.]|uniref:formate/nitrite transporter family protein n=1 Tax=Telmatospirillum sp. TaxID=2079197 RepID=UPI002840752E|nr:formate/nitrite transporter family protein [Telmatospirillum sp.]MDR3438355.1 formate/nitrite transporter family protein [Telmatospirillum sp.]